MQTELEKKVKEYKLSNKVKLLGYRKDVIEILKISDFFIFPSKREGLPVSILEAMACDLPVIASNVRGNRDLIDKENLFEPDDIEVLIKILKTKLKDFENGKLQKVQYKNLEQYSLKNVLKQMAEIYKEN